MFKKLSTISCILITFSVLLTACSIFNPDPLANDDGSLYYDTHGTSNLWLLLGKDLKMNHYSSQPQVQQRIQWYMHHKGYLERVAKRGSPYVYYILQELKLRHMPSEIALLPIIESGFDPFAYSNAGAAGLWQMMPGTASGLSLRQNWWYDGRRDIYASTNAALDYLQYLAKEFNNNWLLALAAYNSGDGTVQRAIKANLKAGKPTDFWDLNLPKQTQQYVPNLLAIAAIVSDPDEYPIQWPTTKLAPFITPVQVGSQIDLAKAAKLAGISLEELYSLNPGFNRWATDPDGKHILLVPADKAEAFKANIAKLPKTDRVTWQRYTIKNGDTLGTIAEKFSTSVTLIKSINNLHDNIIHVGQVLLIPRAKKTFAHTVLDKIKHYIHHDRDLPGPNRVVHVVQPGDSLWKIARAYHLQVKQIRFWNHLKPDQAISPGSELILWTEDKRSYHPISWRPYVLHHTVKSGDTLDTISKHYHVSVAQLKKVNRLTSNILRIGQQLLIPPAQKQLDHHALKAQTYKVKSGDSLIIIAHKYGLKAHRLKTYNGLKNNTIKPGQTLKIPT